MQCTQEEKEKYLAGLSEEDFRERVIRRLFKRLGFLDGRDLCGPEERGKDTVFFEDDKFGVRTAVAVQTKKGNINLAGDPQKNLLEVKTQLRTALESPYNCVQTKSKYVPVKVYLAASGKINEAAREWITANLSADPRIQYLDRDDVIAQVDQYCPEIWLNIRAEVFPYLHALAKLVDDQSVLGPSSTSVAGIKSYYSASDRAFVDLRLVKAKSILKKESGKFREEFKFDEVGVSHLLSLRGEKLIVLGDAGSGKSTILIRIAYAMARAAIVAKANNYRVPVLLRASEMVLAAEGNLLEDMESSVQALATGKASAFSAEDLEAGRVVVLVDGLDEVSLAAQRERIVAKINDFYECYPRCSVVLTTRPYASIESIDGIRGFTRYRISPLSLEKAERMLVSYQKGTVDQEHANEVLRRLSGIHGIELNPLLVTVFALTSEHDRRDIPANITELFSKFTELMLGRWDESKGVAQQYQSRVKEHLISQFANQLHASRKTQFFRADFQVFCERLLKDMNRSADASSLIDEIIERSGLVREVGEELEFRHHLIQEYFAGRGISSTDEIKAVVGDEWWRNPIVFYFGNNPKDVLDLLDVATSSSTRAVDACLTVGLALQTCYLSRLNEKVEVWKWVVSTLALVTERLLDRTESQRYPILDFLIHYIVSRDAVALAGIESEEHDALDWALRLGGSEWHGQLVRFWAYVGLIEIGRLDLLVPLLETHPIESEKLCFAIQSGCRLVEVVRSVGAVQRSAAEELRRRLEPRSALISAKFAKEYRGQLLEYRKGGIVALDQMEDESSESRDGGG